MLACAWRSRCCVVYEFRLPSPCDRFMQHNIEHKGARGTQQPVCMWVVRVHWCCEVYSVNSLLECGQSPPDIFIGQTRVHERTHDIPQWKGTPKSENTIGGQCCLSTCVESVQKEYTFTRCLPRMRKHFLSSWPSAAERFVASCRKGGKGKDIDCLIKVCACVACVFLCTCVACQKQ